MTTASIRELRTQFPKIRHLIETDGEVIVTDRGQPRYVLRNYSPAPAKKPKKQVDYYKRLITRMPKMLTAKQVREIHEQNRGER